MIFNFNLFELTKFWTESDISVEAKTLKEAIKKVKKGDFECNDYIVLYETQEVIKSELENEEGEIIEKWE